MARQIEIIPFGDIHYGSANCRYRAFEELVEYIRKTPDCYGIGMGDYIESILPQDERYDPSQSDELVDEHCVKVIKTLTPIKDKLLCLVTGNHEYKLHSLGYGDPTKRMCRELGVDYAGFCSFIKIGFTPRSRKKPLIIFVHHGWQAGRKTGASVNTVENLAQYWQADIYLVGHSHKLWATREIRLSWGGEQKVIFGNTGTFLETCSRDTTGYGERAGYPPQKLGVLKIKYYPLTEDLHISE